MWILFENEHSINIYALLTISVIWCTLAELFLIQYNSEKVVCITTYSKLSDPFHH